MFAAAIVLFVQWATYSPNFDPAAPEAERRKAVKNLYTFAAHPASLAALPALERAVRSDKSERVRANAVLAIGRVAQAHKKPCPEVLFEALYDDGEYGSVRGTVGIAMHWLKPLPRGSIEKLVRFATSENPIQRDEGLKLLADHAADSPVGLKVLRAATTDPDPMRRHNAHCYLFTATNKLGDIFPPSVLLLAERWDAKELPKDSPAEAHEHRFWLNLTVGSVKGRLAEWTQDRTAEMRDVILESLRHESATVRLATVRYLELMVLARSDASLLVPPALGPLDFGAGVDPKKLAAGLKAITTAPIVRTRAKDMAVKDADAKVREAASRLLSLMSD
ncbi:MAG TPA: hypothetical protein VMZ71_05070 [Gemmataceae bacterium]|nr:hypothetical protein [Gemmataceae bacterium]